MVHSYSMLILSWGYQEIIDYSQEKLERKCLKEYLKEELTWSNKSE